MTAPPPKAPPPELEVLHQDEHLVIVNKPAGFIVHRGWANDRVTVMSALRDQIGQRVWPVHRLDRMTSGALAFVTSAEALRPLMAALEARSDTIDKRYIALVRGRPGEGGSSTTRYRARRRASVCRPRPSGVSCINSRTTRWSKPSR